MKGTPWVPVLAAASAMFVSCGIETVSTLPAPAVYYLSQEDYSSLTLTHDADRYADTDFQGYEIYYRVYPSSVGVGPVQLATDIDTLDSGPLSTLTASPLSYQSLAIGGSDSEFANEALAVTGLSDGDVITLDFTDFLAAANLEETDVQPVLTVTDQSDKHLYRSTSLLDYDTEDLQKFSTLRTDSTRRSDTEALSSSKEYEVDVFIVAYGTSSSLESVYSTPKAWGVIQYIKP